MEANLDLHTILRFDHSSILLQPTYLEGKKKELGYQSSAFDESLKAVFLHFFSFFYCEGGALLQTYIVLSGMWMIKLSAK